MRFAMLFEWPDIHGHLDLGRAFSDDGVNWQLLDEPPPHPLYGAFSSDMHFINGKYRIWYSKADIVTYRWQIEYVESFDMLSFQNRAVAIAPEYEWESFGMLSPTVVLKDGIYHIWYMATGPAVTSAIGYATSSDGLTWTKHPDPVLLKYLAQGVIYDEGLYKMYASDSTLETIDYLESPDGINWDLIGEVLAGTPGTWDEKGVTSPEVMRLGDTYYMWYGGGSSWYPGAWKIGLATSPNGIDWTKHPANPLLSPVEPRVSCGVPDVAYTSGAPLPGKVSGLMADAIGDRSLRLSWNENPTAEEISSYRVYLSKA